MSLNAHNNENLAFYVISYYTERSAKVLNTSELPPPNENKDFDRQTTVFNTSQL